MGIGGDWDLPRPTSFDGKKHRTRFKWENYTPVIKHSNGKSPFSIGNTSSKGSFSIAMLDYQRVFV